MYKDMFLNDPDNIFEPGYKYEYGRQLDPKLRITHYKINFEINDTPIICKQFT